MGRKITNLKVALVHDWLTGMRGGEKVLEALCQLYPEAPIYTLLHNPGSVSPLIESHPIHTSFIDRLPLKKSRYRHYLPLFPTAVEQFNFKGYDLVLSSSHCVAKGILTPPDTLHISYLHTPMRYVWDMYPEYFGTDQLGPVGRLIVPGFANYLRIWDITSSIRVDNFLANSRHVARRILKYYGKKATVIHPPVDSTFFKIQKELEDYYLVVSALVPYKKVDLAIRVFNDLKKRLLIIGDGPEKKKLQRMAGTTIEFLDWQPPNRLAEFYSRCQALIFPGEEDFGIVPVESMGCGRPVIAYARGGALETVIGDERGPGITRTGVFFKNQDPQDLIHAIQEFESLHWDSEAMAKYAKEFDTEVFKRNIQDFIHQKIVEFFE